MTVSWAHGNAALSALKLTLKIDPKHWRCPKLCQSASQEAFVTCPEVRPAILILTVVPRLQNRPFSKLGPQMADHGSHSESRFHQTGGWSWIFFISLISAICGSLCLHVLQGDVPWRAKRSSGSSGQWSGLACPSILDHTHSFQLNQRLSFVLVVLKIESCSQALSYQISPPQQYCHD